MRLPIGGGSSVALKQQLLFPFCCTGSSAIGCGSAPLDLDLDLDLDICSASAWSTGPLPPPPSAAPPADQGDSEQCCREQSHSASPWSAGGNPQRTRETRSVLSRCGIALPLPGLLGEVFPKAALASRRFFSFSFSFFFKSGTGVRARKSRGKDKKTVGRGGGACLQMSPGGCREGRKAGGREGGELGAAQRDPGAPPPPGPPWGEGG